MFIYVRIIVVRMAYDYDIKTTWGMDCALRDSVSFFRDNVINNYLKHEVLGI